MLSSFVLFYTFLQVADGYADHAFWGRPEHMTMFRPSMKLEPWAPGSDLAGEMAAALAASSMAFRDTGKLSFGLRTCYVYHTLFLKLELCCFISFNTKRNHLA